MSVAGVVGGRAGKKGPSNTTRRSSTQHPLLNSVCGASVGKASRRQIDRGRERDRKRDRKKDSETETVTETEKERDSERHTQTEIAVDPVLIPATHLCACW